MVAVVRLDADEAGVSHGTHDVLVDNAPARFGEGVRHDRHSTARAHQLHGAHGIESVMADVVRAAVVEVALERFGAIRDDAVRDESVRHVRPPDGRIGTGDGEHLLVRDVDVLTQALHHALRSREARRAGLLEFGEQFAVCGREVGKQMDADPLVLARDLDAGYEVDAVLTGGSGCLVPTTRRVVIGEGDDVEAGASRFCDHLSRRRRAVATGGVGVKVDTHAHTLALLVVESSRSDDDTTTGEAMPQPVRYAVWLMLAGALVQALSTLTTALDREGIRAQTARLADEFDRSLDGKALERATDQAYWFGVGTGVTFVALWLVVARLCAIGRTSGRPLATLFATVYTFTFAFSAVRSFGPGAFLGLVTAVVGVSAVYLLWRRPVTPWLARCAARRSQGA